MKTRAGRPCHALNPEPSAMPLPFKILADLPREDVEALESFSREKRRTVDECHEWLLARGYTISRSAVGNWKMAFEKQLVAERSGRSIELAKALKESLSAGEFSDVADAAVMQLTQVVFEQAVMLEAGGAIDAEQVELMTRSMKNLAGTKGQLTKLLEEQRRRQKEAVEEASKVAQSGGSGDAVVEKVRQILGISGGKAA
jgi:hypothetical protein